MVDPVIYLSISLQNFQFHFLLFLVFVTLFYTRLSPFKTKRKLEQKIHKKTKILHPKNNTNKIQKAENVLILVKRRIINVKCGKKKNLMCFLLLFNCQKHMILLLLFFSLFFNVFTFFYPVFRIVCFI